MIFVSRKKYKRCKRQLEDVQVRLASTKIELIDAHNDVRYLRYRIIRAFNGFNELCEKNNQPLPFDLKLIEESLADKGHIEIEETAEDYICASYKE